MLNVRKFYSSGRGSRAIPIPFSFQTANLFASFLPSQVFFREISFCPPRKTSPNKHPFLYSFKKAFWINRKILPENGGRRCPSGPDQYLGHPLVSLPLSLDYKRFVYRDWYHLPFSPLHGCLWISAFPLIQRLAWPPLFVALLKGLFQKKLIWTPMCYS